MKVRPMLKIIAVVLSLVPAVSIAQEDEGRLTITGSARVVVEPDVVRAIGDVYVQDDSAAKAMDAAKERLRRLRRAMDSHGDVRISRVTVGQGRSAGKRLIGSDDPGFAAQGRVTVTLADLDKAGIALDVLANAGIDGIARLEYDVVDRLPILTDLREKAVGDAVERAETYARAARLTLGPIVELTEIRSDTSSPHRGPTYRTSSYGAQGTAGSSAIVIEATVLLRWAVE